MAKKKINRQQSKIVIAETRMRRFLAMIIDWYLTQMISVIPITFYLRDGDYLKPHMFEYTSYPFMTGLALIIFSLIVGVIYYWVVPSFLFKGQTLGKKICKIKIVTEDYQPVNAKILFVRDMIASTWLEGGIIITATSIHKLVGLFGYSQIATYWQYLTYAVTIISIIYAYFNKQSQSFHDKIAKTIVVKD